MEDYTVLYIYIYIYILALYNNYIYKWHACPVSAPSFLERWGRGGEGGGGGMKGEDK